MHWLIIGGQERRWCSTGAMTGVRARRHRTERGEPRGRGGVEFFKQSTRGSVVAADGGTRCDDVAMSGVQCT